MKAISQATQHCHGYRGRLGQEERDEDHVVAVIATTTTFVIGWIVTGSALAGGVIASIEFWAKLALYYAHERAWSRAH